MRGNAAQGAAEPADPARRTEEGSGRSDPRAEAGTEETLSVVHPWQENGRRFVTLFAMLKAYAMSFYQMGGALASLQLFFETLPGTGKLADRAESHSANVTEALRVLCVELDLQFSLKAVARLNKELEGGAPDTGKLAALLAEIETRVQEELEERSLFFVAPVKAARYSDFRPGWEAALLKFPIATDVEEAEKCFALDRWTACVFHLMRTVEIGVQALGTYLSIAVAVTEPWGTVVREIQKAVQAMPKASAAEKDAQSKFADVADALFQINLAWRIPAMHPRTPGSSYTEEQASDALSRVKAFMRTLAEALP